MSEILKGETTNNMIINGRRTSVLHRLPLDKLALIGTLILIFCFFAAIGPSGFASVRNIETISRQTALTAAAALGTTVIIIAAGIDLSVGSLVALVTVVVAWLLNKGFSPWIAGVGGIVAGLLCGLVNGALITGLRVVPFIVTLGTLLLYRGVAKGIAKEQRIVAPDSFLSDLLSSLSRSQRWMILPTGVWMVIACSILTAFILHRTVFGRRVFSIGSNEAAAKLCGVPVIRVKLLIYSIGGAFTGLAGLLQYSRLAVGDPTVAVGLELDVIAAVVIGGGSLSGGQGSVLGSLVGALIMTTIRSGCSQMGLPNWVQEIVTGTIIVIAVTLDRFRRSRRDST
jgi:ribose/xylose/arabinose/galactoside ABC-type transport system permease subunit